MAYYPNYVYSLLTFIAILLVVLPARWHLRVWNIGTCLFMLWAATGCFIYFTNSIVWNGNTTNWAPVWCDISTRVQLALNTGMAVAVLCINRRLYCISHGGTPSTPAQKRRVIIVDLAVSLGIPLIQICLSYIVENHRFYIFEDVGCLPAIAPVWPSILIFEVCSLIVSCVSTVYAALSIRAFWTKRLLFKKFLSANKDLNVNLYLRVIFFSAADILHGIPLTSYVLYFNVRRIQPYRGFESLHATAGEVVQFPAAVWHNDPTLRFQAEFARWVTLACSFTFIVFFAFAPDARNNYRSAISSVARRVGVCQSSMRPLTTRSTLRTSTAQSRSVTDCSKQDTLGSLPFYDMEDRVVTADSKMPIECWKSSESFNTVSSIEFYNSPPHKDLPLIPEVPVTSVQNHTVEPSRTDIPMSV